MKLALLAAASLLVLCFAPAQYFGRQHDDVLYWLAAKGLLGGAYCIPSSPGCPPFAVGNPGWPYLLLPVAALTDDPRWAQAYSAAILAAGPLALWAWLRRRVKEDAAVLAALCFASSPLVLSQAGCAMSEAPYLLAMLAALAAAESGRPGAAGAAGAAMMLLRSAALSALPALALPFRKKPRAAALAVLPAAAVYAAWSAWSAARTGGIDKLSLLGTTYLGGGPLRPARVALSNAAYYLNEWGGSLLPPSGTGSLAVGFALAALAAWGVRKALARRKDDPAAWALIGACVLHLLWGWRYERYFVTLLPLLLWALAEGAGRRAKAALGTVLALQLVFQTLPRLGRPGPWDEPELGRTYAWLAARPRPALLSSALFARDGWYAGMPSLPLPMAGDAKELAAALKARRVSYVLRVDGADLGMPARDASSLLGTLDALYSRLEDRRYFRKSHAEPAERASIYEPL